MPSRPFRLHAVAAVLLAATATSQARACVHGELEAGGLVYPAKAFEVGQTKCPRAEDLARPSREQRIALERKQAAAEELTRQAAQGHVVHRLSDDQCTNLILRVPGYATAYPLVPTWPGPGSPNPWNPYLTAQENWCIGLMQSHTSPADNQFPGLLPSGWHAVPIGNGSWQITR